MSIVLNLGICTWTCKVGQSDSTLKIRLKLTGTSASCESCFWCATIFNKSIKEQEYVAEDNNSNNTFQNLFKFTTFGKIFKDKSLLVSFGIAGTHLFYQRVSS